MCLQSLRILVADDSPNVREMIVLALEAQGYSVNGVADGQEALDKIAEANRSDKAYDAVLLDYAMPGMDGLTCALKIREAQPEGKPELAVGFFTAHADLEMPQSILNKLHARSWSKLNLVEMIHDLPAWLGNKRKSTLDPKWL